MRAVALPPTPHWRWGGRSLIGWHLGGWICLLLLVFLQPFGLIAADTKLDLAVDPLGFLAGALSPYSDIFPLGQLQNQAYGYLFPQGAFFVLTDFLPDWIAQRLWWGLILIVGWSGMLALSRRAGLNSWAGAIAAAAFVFSPRTLSTLTAISSETWPVMLAPWVIYPFLGAKVGRREVAAAVIPVALMGAVNATATLAACVPAAVVIIYRREFKALAAWLLGCAAVSLWWLGPLVILGRYAPPFTEFIESAFVTTRWLNLPEILRGTTSWSPFVDTERQAGHLLVTQPTFVLATALVAAVGLAGLSRAGRVWKLMLVVGLLILGCHAAFYLDFLDGPGVFMRNLHKFDPLVRIPLCLGVGHAAWLLRGSGQRESAQRLSAQRESAQRLSAQRESAQRLSAQRLSAQRLSALGLVIMLLAVSAAPAWSGRLLPQGAYAQIPDYWYEATDFINETATNTRTLIYPPRMFARDEWGWTRDEPAQPLLEVPWVVRDAIPLVPPEAIRGLDGVMAAVKQGRYESLQRLGVGAIISRTPLPKGDFSQQRRFGPLTVAIIDPDRDILLTSSTPVRVAGGGEALAFIDGPAQLVTSHAQIVTDTPLLIDRNYGALEGVSAPLSAQDDSTVKNRLRDYPSAGASVSVRESGGRIGASSSWADATALGTNPAASVTAAVDGRRETFWWPAPGDIGWLEFSGNYPARTNITLEASANTTVIIHNGDALTRVRLEEKTPRTVTVPGGATGKIRVQLTRRVGLNAQIVDHEVHRVVRVPDTSPNVQEFFFQRLLVDTTVLIREFTAPREMTVTLAANRWVSIDGQDYFPGQKFVLPAGEHHLETRARWLKLSTAEVPTGSYESSGRDIAPAPVERLLVTGRAYNRGLRGYLDGQALEPRSADAATQAFVIPAGAKGHFTMTFAATGLYRGFLAGGALLGLITLISCCLAARGASTKPWRDTKRPGAAGTPPVTHEASLGRPVSLGRLPLAGLPVLLALPVLVVLQALLGWPVAIGALIGWATARFSGLPHAPLSFGLMAAAGAMLARGPWTAGFYAGDFWLTVAFAAAAVAVAVQAPPPSNN